MKKLYIFFIFVCLTNFAKAQCYSVSTIPYTPSTYSGTNISLGGNVFSPTIPIGFSFCFYGASYDSLRIFSNGVVTFNTNLLHDTMDIWWQPHVTLPNPYVTAGPHNCIMFPWQDLDPSLGGTITYSLTGTPPNRIFIVSFDNVPMDSCTKLFKGQVKLFETTYVIETHIANKDTCLNWGGFAIHGLHGPVVGLGMNTGVFVSGRNYPNQWTTTNEGMRFTPTCDVCTGLADDENNLLQNNFLLFPNPTTDNLTIETPQKATIEILNIEGQIIKTINTADKQTTIDLRNLSSGVYIIKAKTERGVAVKKFIKE